MHTAVGVIGGDVRSVGNRPAQAGEETPDAWLTTLNIVPRAQVTIKR